MQEPQFAQVVGAEDLTRTEAIGGAAWGAGASEEHPCLNCNCTALAGIMGGLLRATTAESATPVKMQARLAEVEKEAETARAAAQVVWPSRSRGAQHGYSNTHSSSLHLSLATQYRPRLLTASSLEKLRLHLHVGSRRSPAPALCH